MRRTLSATAIAVLILSGCSERSGDNSAFCGLTQLASGNLVLDHMSAPFRFMTTAPSGLGDTVVTRAIGHPTSISVAESDSTLFYRYLGQGFPSLPGFALALVDDSSEVFRGVMLFEPETPQNFPAIGYIQGPRGLVMPLAGLRVNWSEVNDPQCPIFADSIVFLDSLESREP